MHSFYLHNKEEAFELVQYSTLLLCPPHLLDIGPHFGFPQQADTNVVTDEACRICILWEHDNGITAECGLLHL